MENKEYLEFAKEIAYEAGKIMLKYYNAKDLLNKVKNIHPIYETSRKIIGDDFAKYHLYSKTNYYLLGIKSNSFLHESTFAFNEKVLLKGLEFFIKLINL